MSLYGRALELYLSGLGRRLRAASADPGRAQRRVLAKLLARGRDTWFGRQHDFASIRTPADFARAVPIADYVGRLDVFQRILEGEPDVCWRGRTRIFARTSGTTAGMKYIPITPAMRRNHVRAGLAVLAAAQRSEPGIVGRILEGEMVQMGGMPLREVPPMAPTNTGAGAAGGPPLHGERRAAARSKARFGGIADCAYGWIPWPLSRRYVRKRDVLALEDFEERTEAMARRLASADIRMKADLPTWALAFFERVCRIAGVDPCGGISRVWPNFLLFVHGGVNFEPYRPVYERYLRPDHHVRRLEVYTSSEAFIGVQAGFGEEGLELLVDNEVFFEFVPLDAWGTPEAPRLTIDQVEKDVPYCVVISTSGGLWAYDLGDVVRLLSLRPPRVVFAGRHQHFMNAFGEHMIGEDVEKGIAAACEATGARVTAFTAAPVYPDPDFRRERAGAHHYLVEFERGPEGRDLSGFAGELDQALRDINMNYRSKRRGDSLIGPPEVAAVPAGTFYAWMKRRGKLGGQNKVPVCANDRRYVDDILAIVGETAQG